MAVELSESYLLKQFVAPDYRLARIVRLNKTTADVVTCKGDIELRVPYAAMLFELPSPGALAKRGRR